MIFFFPVYLQQKKIFLSPAHHPFQTHANAQKQTVDLTHVCEKKDQKKIQAKTKLKPFIRRNKETKNRFQKQVDCVIFTCCLSNSTDKGC